MVRNTTPDIVGDIVESLVRIIPQKIEVSLLPLHEQLYAGDLSDTERRAAQSHSMDDFVFDRW